MDLVADFRALKEEGRGGGAQGAAQAEGGQGGGGGRAVLPEGVQLVGGEALLEEGDDGAKALLVPEGTFLKLVLPAAPWALKEDGRLHEYTLVLALRLGEMPSAPLPLFNGGGPPAQGDKVRAAAAAPPLPPIPPTPPMLPQPSPHPQPHPSPAQVESVQVYKNGGVGALNDMGTQEAAVHAERWCWVVVTRKKGARYLVITPRGRPGAGWWSRARRARRAPPSST